MGISLHFHQSILQLIKFLSVLDQQRLWKCWNFVNSSKNNFTFPALVNYLVLRTFPSWIQNAVRLKNYGIQWAGFILLQKSVTVSLNFHQRILQLIETGDRLRRSWFSISRDRFEYITSLGHIYTYPRSPLSFWVC